MSSGWQFIVADTAGNALGEITAATSRVLTFNLDDSCNITFNLPGRHPQAYLITETATDLIAYRDGQKIFRGRIAASTDTVGADLTYANLAGPTNSGGHDSTFSAVDYRAMLNARALWPGCTATFTNVDQATIVAQLLADTQALTGGSWGITTPSPATGVLRTRAYNVGASLGQTITDLGDTVNGFDWEVDANLHLNLHYPARGQVGQTQLDYGGNVVTVARTVDPSNYANAVLTTGASTLTAAAAYTTSTVTVSGSGADGAPVSPTRSPGAADVTTFGPQGRWEQVFSDPDINEQATLVQRAQYELAFADQAPATYQVNLSAGWWNPGSFWLGDVVGLYVDDGRMQVNAALRATQFVVQLGDDGGEYITVTLSPALVLRSDDTTPVPASKSIGTALVATDVIVKAKGTTPASYFSTLVAVKQYAQALRRLA